MLGNQVLVSAVVGWTVAQVLKTLIDFALNKSFNAERLVGSGLIYYCNQRHAMLHTNA